MAITPGYKKFKRYIFQEDENYILDSEWTHASTVELDGGKTLDQKMSEVDIEVSSLKKSVSDGKKKVAGAITDQGVDTAADATFDTLATNIRNIGSNKYEEGKKSAMVGTASADDVLETKTFTNSSSIGQSGSMSNRGAWIGNSNGNENVNIPRGYHDGNGYVSCEGAYNAGYQAGTSNLPTLAPINACKPNAYYLNQGGDGAVHVGDDVVIQITNKDYYNKIKAWTKGETGAFIKKYNIDDHTSGETLATGNPAVADIPKDCDYVIIGIDMLFGSSGIIGIYGTIYKE